MKLGRSQQAWDNVHCSHHLGLIPNNRAGFSFNRYGAKDWTSLGKEEKTIKINTHKLHLTLKARKPSILPSLVRVPSTPFMLLPFLVKFVLYLSLHCEKNENKQKEAGFGPFKKHWYWGQTLMKCIPQIGTSNEWHK